VSNTFDVTSNPFDATSNTLDAASNTFDGVLLKANNLTLQFTARFLRARMQQFYDPDCFVAGL
jgi:hypothetical protein